MYSILAEHSRRPPPFSVYTAEELWTDPHMAEQMLAFHLDPDQDLASRNHAFVQRSVAWLNRRFDLGAGKRVLDLGCGPGLYANALAELGASVTGVDFSQNSLAYARSEAESRGLDVIYHNGDYLDLELRATFDLILLIFGDFCPLGPNERRSLLERVKEWLAPGGRFVFDVSSSALFESLEESVSYEEAHEGGFWSPDPHFVFMKRFKYGTDLAYLDRYLVVEADRYREFFNWIQCYDLPGLRAELNAAGWGVDATFGNVAGDVFDPDWQFFAVIAEPSASDPAPRTKGRVS
jgi:SAM-dependent methyltransferase